MSGPGKVFRAEGFLLKGFESREVFVWVVCLHSGFKVGSKDTGVLDVYAKESMRKILVNGAIFFS